MQQRRLSALRSASMREKRMILSSSPGRSSPALRWVCVAVLLSACRGAAGAPVDSHPTLMRGEHDAGLVSSVGGSVADALVIGDLGPGRFELQAKVALEVATVANIEVRLEDGRFSPVGHLDGDFGYRLVESCPAPHRPVEDCRRLTAGEHLVPVPWSGFGCSAQCNAQCGHDAFRPGIYRLVVRGCAGSTVRYEGPLFEVPPTPEMVPRWRAASGAQQAYVMRLDPRDLKEGAEARGSDRVAGYRVIPGTKRPLNATLLPKLVTWLRAEKGFDDKVEKRCVRKNMVGWLLVRKRLDGSDEATAVAVDFACNSITISGEKPPDTMSSSYFDPSRVDLLSLARQALPLDSELARLR